MFSISKLLSTSYRAIIASSAALLLSGIMISSAGAADIATTYNNSCAACHDSGALNAIKKGDSAKWQQLIKQKSMPTLIKSVKVVCRRCQQVVFATNVVRTTIVNLSSI
ncbi:c-type cytochrome [Psychrobacter sp. ER1]|uniref:c-type cytochrome n=1 Tax=Psychrobacter sp. ER1 TaxID=3406645 RepID=UPI003B42F683